MCKYEIDDILNIDALVSAVVNSDEFVDTVAESRENQLKGMVEDAIADYDFSDEIKNEVVDYSSDISDLVDESNDLKSRTSELEEKVERLEGEVEDIDFDSDAFSKAVYACTQNDIECSINDKLYSGEFTRRVHDITPDVSGWENQIADLQNEVEDLKEAIRVRDLNYDGFIREVEEFKKNIGVTIIHLESRINIGTESRIVIMDRIKASRILRWLFNQPI